MKIAIEGCCHGELDKIYATLQHLEHENQIKVDLLIICGDFQSIRNEKDLDSMAVPEKYKEIGCFWKYYSSEKRAPVLTIFIGGNHEASNYLMELPYGGWVAENIYYLGYANVINFGNIRIAGLSGIYKAVDYNKGHFECPPFNSSTAHSAYHVRNLEVFRLSQIKKKIDIFISHDWPSSVYNQGDCTELLRYKPYFAEEINANTLGSSKNEYLLKHLKPTYWFSAHLHVKFSCIYKHNMHDPTSQETTKFLSLDKCLPKRKFLQVIDIPSDSVNPNLSLDEEWLCILKKTDHLLSVDSYQRAPIAQSENLNILPEDLKEIQEDFQSSFEIPSNFKQTAPWYQQTNELSNQDVYLNEQTTLFCEMLNLRDPIRLILEKRGQRTVVSESTTQMYNNLLDEDD